MVKKQEINIINQYFNRLKVLEKTKSKDRNKFTYKCLCSCGKIVYTTSYKLRTKRIQSCGCLQKDKASAHFKSLNNKPTIIGKIYRCYWTRIHRNAIKRKLEFNITPEYVWCLYLEQQGKCALSGIYLEFGYTGTQSYSSKEQTVSLDRINSNLGYIKGNVQWIHKDINIMKNKLEQNYFIELCKCIVNHQG